MLLSTEFSHSGDKTEAALFYQLINVIQPDVHKKGV